LAVIPEESSKDLISTLEEKDIPYQKYSDNQERVDIIKGMDGVRFSARNKTPITPNMSDKERYNALNGEELFAVTDITDVNDQKNLEIKSFNSKAKTITTKETITKETIKNHV